MDIFGLPIQGFIFTIFLPFLFFYLFLYALLRKTKILGDSKQADSLSSMISLVLSALGIISLYSLGLTVWLPYLAAFFAVAAFVVLYLFGITTYGAGKISSYSSGSHFKKDTEKRYDSLVKDCKNLWAKYKEKKSSEQQAQEMVGKINELEMLSQKVGKSLYEYEWYNEYSSELKKHLSGAGQK